MRKTLITLCIVLLITPLMIAQERTGNIYGKVTDEDGTPLPGVTLTLDGEYIRTMNTVTSANGNYRFVALPPAKDYQLTAKLPGFQTEILSNIIVRVDSNTRINITLRMGEIEEEVTVTAVSPIVDVKTTKVSHNVDRSILQSLPSARDPWVIAQMAPGVVMDRENVGGSESGQQSDMIVRGQTGGQTTYNIDGMNVTDPDAIGASPGYYDFDSFEEIDFTLGGADVTQAQAGINLNIVTRRGGNRPTVGGRVFWTESGFQANKEDLLEELQAENLGFEGIPEIRDIKDFGINVGAPILTDKLWAWMYFGVQDIRTTTELGVDDDTYLQNMGLKVNAQIVPENRAEIMFTFGKKEKWGRAASFSFPGGYKQGEPQHFGNPIHKIQDEHMFGTDLFVSAKYVYTNVGFSLTPMDDLDFVKVPWYDDGAQIWQAPGPLGGGPAGYDRVEYIRPVNTTALRTTYFNDDLFGASHEILVGVEYNYRGGTTDDEREGHMDVTWNNQGPVADFDGDGSEDPAPSPYFMWWDIDRYLFEEGIVKHYQAYLRDTISFGNFTILAGARYDYQNPISGAQDARAVYDHPIWYGEDAITTPEVRSFIETFLPPAKYDEDRQVTAFEGGNYYWSDISPRLGITWDIFGDGKTIGKLSFSRYTQFMDIDIGENWRVPGFGGDMQFWWWDDGDFVAQMNELYWTYSGGHANPYQLYRVFDDQGNFQGDLEDAEGRFYSGLPFQSEVDPLARPVNQFSKDTGSTHTYEIQATLERELLPDLGLAINGSWRRYDNYYNDANFWMDDDGNIIYEENEDMYIEGYPLPVQIPEDEMTARYDWDLSNWDGTIGEDAANNPWYFLDPDYQGVFNAASYTQYEVYRPTDYWEEWYGVDIILNKRFSNNWMLNISATFQNEKRHGVGFTMGDTDFDKSNAWALDGRPYSGWTYARWMVKVSGLYQLPLGFNISGFFTAREGFKENATIGLRNRWYDGPYNYRNRSITIYLKPYRSIQHPTYYRLDLRLEKMINIAEVGTAHIMVDAFNVFNKGIVLNTTGENWGRYYYYGPDSPKNFFRPDSHPNEVNDILDPFIVRFGIRFEF